MSMTHWIRFHHAGETRIGTLADGQIRIHDGSLFDQPRDTGQTVALADVEVLTPTEPTKMVCLWNNFQALAAKLNLPVPPEPLYFFKAPNTWRAAGQPIEVPPSYPGKVVYEGELGIVIGKRCKAVSEAEAPNFVFGYTCVNDVTAAELINKDPTFAQWTRAKNFDTFGVFGPVIATGLDPDSLVIRTVLDGRERQNYPVSDMVFKPFQLVSLISQDMTLEPGDIISCGTSIGVGSMKPGARVEVVIDGIGTLANDYQTRQ